MHDKNKKNALCLDEMVMQVTQANGLNNANNTLKAFHFGIILSNPIEINSHTNSPYIVIDTQ